MWKGCSYAPGGGGLWGAGVDSWPVEQEAAGFSRGSDWGLSVMCVVVKLEKNMFCSWGQFFKNVGPYDLEKQRVGAKCRHLWDMSVRVAGVGWREVVWVDFFQSLFS